MTTNRLRVLTQATPHYFHAGERKTVPWRPTDYLARLYPEDRDLFMSFYPGVAAVMPDIGETWALQLQGGVPE